MTDPDMLLDIMEGTAERFIITEAFKRFEKAYVEQRYVYKLIEDNWSKLVLKKKAKMLNWLNSQKIINKLYKTTAVDSSMAVILWSRRRKK